MKVDQSRRPDRKEDSDDQPNPGLLYLLPRLHLCAVRVSPSLRFRTTGSLLRERSDREPQDRFSLPVLR